VNGFGSYITTIGITESISNVRLVFGQWVLPWQPFSLCLKFSANCVTIGIPQHTSAPESLVAFFVRLRSSRVAPKSCQPMLLL
jgi:hypothetical protein